MNTLQVLLSYFILPFVINQELVMSSTSDIDSNRADVSKYLNTYIL